MEFGPANDMGLFEVEEQDEGDQWMATLPFLGTI